MDTNELQTKGATSSLNRYHQSAPSKEHRSEDLPIQKSAWRRTHEALGFARGYNLPLFVTMAGGLFGFSLARIDFIAAQAGFKNKSAPGEWYWYREGLYRIGIQIHLATIIPAGLLVVWQFLPVIRHKAILFHRINGYLCLVLFLISDVGAMLIVRRSFGGSVTAMVVSCTNDMISRRLA